MKVIEVPKPVALVALHGKPFLEQDGKPQMATFREFALGLLTAQPFGKGMAAVVEQNKIAKLIDEANGTLELEDEHHRKLVAALDSVQFDTTKAHNLIPFMRAIKEAKEK